MVDNIKINYHPADNFIKEYFHSDYHAENINVGEFLLQRIEAVVNLCEKRGEIKISGDLEFNVYAGAFLAKDSVISNPINLNDQGIKLPANLLLPSNSYYGSFTDSYGIAKINLHLDSTTSLYSHLSDLWISYLVTHEVGHKIFDSTKDPITYAQTNYLIQSNELSETYFRHIELRADSWAAKILGPDIMEKLIPEKDLSRIIDTQSNLTNAQRIKSMKDGLYSTVLEKTLNKINEKEKFNSPKDFAENFIAYNSRINHLTRF